LVDVVVTKENLHAAFLFNAPATKTPDLQAYGYADESMAQISIVSEMPAYSTVRATWKKREDQ
jgi:hypothetical protein